MSLMCFVLPRTVPPTLVISIFSDNCLGSMVRYFYRSVTTHKLRIMSINNAPGLFSEFKSTPAPEQSSINLPEFSSGPTLPHRPIDCGTGVILAGHSFHRPIVSSIPGLCEGGELQRQWRSIDGSSDDNELDFLPLRTNRLLKHDCRSDDEMFGEGDGAGEKAANGKADAMEVEDGEDDEKENSPASPAKVSILPGCLLSSRRCKRYPHVLPLLALPLLSITPPLPQRLKRRRWTSGVCFDLCLTSVHIVPRFSKFKHTW